MIKTLLLALSFFSTVALAEDIEKDFDSLGGNSILLEKTKAIQGETSVQIVQDRTVDRVKKWEFAPVYENILGGDPYLKSEGYGINVHFHINPRLSLGVRSLFMANQLTEEAENLINDTSITGTGVIPAMDYLKSQNMAVLNWYPIYGKVAWLNKGVAQFDVYSSVAAGTVALKSGNSSSWSAGLGVGLWWTKHISTRIEGRYQTYEAQDYKSKKQMDLTVLGIQMGYIL